MDSGELIVVDVGHGNCAIIRHGTEAIVLDAPAKPIVARVLDELGILAIRALLISHADADHLSGAIPLILNRSRPVEKVYVNPDNRESLRWREFRRAVAMAEKEFHLITKVHPSLSTSNSGSVVLEKTSLEIIHPQADMCLTGVGNVDTEGRTVNANSMSAVVLVQHDGKRICLLAADADRDSLDRMIDFGADLRAKVLVFPHHGGRPGSRDGKAFARDFVSRVAPEVVLFSLGRGAHGTPRPEIVAGVKEAVVPSVSPYIACTQLSERCARKLPTGTSRQIDSRSDGFKDGKCCAGTVSIPLTDGGLDKFLAQLRAEHAVFIKKEVPGALCLKGTK